MTDIFVGIEDIKKMHPNEWILLGDPEMKNTTVLGGIVLYHSKDKKEVCYIGKDKTTNYETVTITFAGDLKQQRKIGILKQI
jgi:hypothetical protein